MAVLALLAGFFAAGAFARRILPNHVAAGPGLDLHPVQTVLSPQFAVVAGASGQVGAGPQLQSHRRVGRLWPSRSPSISMRLARDGKYFSGFAQNAGPLGLGPRTNYGSIIIPDDHDDGGVDSLTPVLSDISDQGSEALQAFIAREEEMRAGQEARLAAEPEEKAEAADSGAEAEAEKEKVKSDTKARATEKARLAPKAQVNEAQTELARTDWEQSNHMSPSEDIYWTRSGTFDYDKSTEDSYAIPQFTGPNKEIRPLLDYTWHKKYNEERCMLQDRIINDLAMKGDADSELLPWVIFTAGAMGAGKGYVMDWMEKQGCLPLNKFVSIDPDEIRQTLPEWPGYVAKDPLTAAIKTQREAGHIAEILGYKSLGERWNVIFDGSLHDVEWYKVFFQKLRQKFPGIRLMILHIQAEREAVLRRAEKRGRETGRMVRRELLESSLDAVPKSVSVLAPYVDVCIRVANKDGQEPRFEHEATALHPLPSVTINTDYVKLLWHPLDTDGDGELSREEVHAAMALGILTDEVLGTMDTDHDGAISKQEFQAAVRMARKSATLLLA